MFRLPEKEQEQFLFKDAAELAAAVEKLVEKPVVEMPLPPGKSHGELTQLSRLRFAGFGTKSRRRAPRG
jgi:hypothetical protein